MGYPLPKERGMPEKKKRNPIWNGFPPNCSVLLYLGFAEIRLDPSGPASIRLPSVPFGEVEGTSGKGKSGANGDRYGTKVRMQTDR